MSVSLSFLTSEHMLDVQEFWTWLRMCQMVIPSREV